ncbi:DUF3298 domain-containing protein [Aquipseudomonas alcaligenes]|uniref:DUF3298 and DUF4163 domain-containing protein n=1 Tax=Aquipseudomonas alcaligenes TaxID=43263 RepID=UPI0037493A47
MRCIATAGLLSLTLLLSGCQAMLLAAKPESGLATSRQAWEHRAPGCAAKDCALVNIDLQTLNELPELNARIEQELLKLTIELPGDPPPASLELYEKEFLASAQPGWMSYLQAKVLEQHDRLVVIELSSYRFTGGAHGIPGRAYLNYDREKGRLLSQDDLLLPDGETAFWQQAELAYQAWLKTNGLDQDLEYQANWPFVRTANVALLRDSVMLKYEVGRIAPYTSGHPDLRIPYSRLNGILKPIYFPGRG